MIDAVQATCSITDELWRCDRGGGGGAQGSGRNRLSRNRGSAALRLIRQPGPTSFRLLARPSSAVCPMRAQRTTTVVVRAGHWPAPSANQMHSFTSADRRYQACETWPSVRPQSGFFALEQNVQHSLGHLMPCPHHAILKEFFYVDES